MHRFYRHFKGKPYRLIGTAKFSESLEDMTVYETLYENPEDKVWVRPKAMFDEVIERDGKKIARFRPVPQVIEKLEALPDDGIGEEILNIANKVLNPMSLDKFKEKFSDKKNTLILMCRIENELVGFKVGFEQTPGTFYSWLGGVDPSFQRLGVATAMMNSMFDWCRSRGYTSVETKTTNTNRAMILLNVVSGFDVIDIKPDKNGVRKILMAKNLTSAPK